MVVGFAGEAVVKPKTAGVETNPVADEVVWSLCDTALVAMGTVGGVLYIFLTSTSTQFTTFSFISSSRG